jgi:hypothetical protein
VGQDLHTVEMLNGSSPLSNPDRVKMVLLLGVANVAGAASAAVTTAITGLDLPANYIVDVECNQDVFVTITNKTNSGFNVVMTPLTGVAVAAGTFNVRVMA